MPSTDRQVCRVARRSRPSVPEPPSFAELLTEAIEQPGVISACYSLFHEFSVGNQLAAWAQCIQRKIPLGPIHTFKGWLSLNRHVKRGEKAIVLCMPVTWKERREPDVRSSEPAQSAAPAGTDAEAHEVTRRRFVWRPNWFVLSQTEGADYAPVLAPNWDEHLALQQLEIERVPFQIVNGNVQGYAFERKVAVSPIAHLPHRTLIHELAHVVLGHTSEGERQVDSDETTPRDVREVEAEAVAYIVTQSLDMPGEEFSRGYLQHWLCGQKIEERSAHRIFHATDVILKAGRPKPVTESPDSAD